MPCWRKGKKLSLVTWNLCPVEANTLLSWGFCDRSGAEGKGSILFEQAVSRIRPSLHGILKKNSALPFQLGAFAPSQPGEPAASPGHFEAGKQPSWNSGVWLQISVWNPWAVFFSVGKGARSCIQPSVRNTGIPFVGWKKRVPAGSKQFIQELPSAMLGKGPETIEEAGFCCRSKHFDFKVRFSAKWNIHMYLYIYTYLNTLIILPYLYLISWFASSPNHCASNLFHFMKMPEMFCRKTVPSPGKAQQGNWVAMHLHLRTKRKLVILWPWRRS